MARVAIEPRYRATRLYDHPRITNRRNTVRRYGDTIVQLCSFAVFAFIGLVGRGRGPQGVQRPCRVIRHRLHLYSFLITEGAAASRS